MPHALPPSIPHWLRPPTGPASALLQEPGRLAEPTFTDNLLIVLPTAQLSMFYVSDCEFRTVLAGTTKLEYDMYCNIRLDLCKDSVDDDEYDNSHGINKIVDN